MDPAVVIFYGLPAACLFFFGLMFIFSFWLGKQNTLYEPLDTKTDSVPVAAELQGELDRVEAKMFWVRDELYWFPMRYLSPRMQVSLYEDEEVKDESLCTCHRIWVQLEHEACPIHPSWVTMNPFDMRWEHWVPLYMLFAPLILWWVHDRRYYDITPEIAALSALMAVLVIAVPMFFIVQSNKRRKARVNDAYLRHYHWVASNERPAMRKKLRAARAEILERMAARV